MSYLKRPGTTAAHQIIRHRNNQNQQQQPNRPNLCYSPLSPPTPMTYKPFLLKEDGELKIPLFLLKLWNIVEIPDYWEIVRWDETGLSFHIMDPKKFCDEILPQYFKHKNLNSLVRQLNMYGFRKNTPIDRSGLARAESDQDHLEFMHPYFRRDHPELLANIKRKVPNKPSASVLQQQLQAIAGADGSGGGGGGGGAVAVHTKDLTNIFNELETLKERQKSMEMRMEELTKENEMLWTEMAHVRGTHLKQQQIVNKLIQFLVALVGPAATNKQHSARLGKRHMYVLEDAAYSGGGGAGNPGNSQKRFRDEFGDGFDGNGSTAAGGGAGGISLYFAQTFSSGRSVNVHNGGGGNGTGGPPQQQLQQILPANASEILDRLINDITTTGTAAAFSSGGHQAGNYPYTGGHGGGTRSTSGGSLSTSSSGPIIAEVTEELEQQLNPCGGEPAMFQVGGAPIVTGTGQQPMAVVVSTAPVAQMQVQQPGQAVPIVEQQAPAFRGYSQSFGSASGAPPTKRAAFQDQRKSAQIPTQQPQQMQQQPQQVVIYQPIAPKPGQQQLQQGQQMVMLQPIQQQMGGGQQAVQLVPVLDGRQCPTAPPMGQRYIVGGNVAQQQQQQVQQVSPPQSQQQQLPMQYCPMQQQPQQLPQKILSNSPLVAQPLSSDSSLQQSPEQQIGNPAMDAPLTEGMMLNEREMADIAGLNAYLEKANLILDENGARFHTLTNSIGEHWDSVGGMDADDFQDLFEIDTPTDGNAGAVQMGGGEQQQQVQGGQFGRGGPNAPNQLSPPFGPNESQHYAAEHGQHLDFPYTDASPPKS